MAAWVQLENDVRLSSLYLVYHTPVFFVTGDMHKHLYCMCGLLRPSDNIKLVSVLHVFLLSVVNVNKCQSYFLRACQLLLLLGL